MFQSDHGILTYGRQLMYIAVGPWKGKATNRKRMLKAVFPLVTLLIIGRFFSAYGGMVVQGLGPVNIITRLVFMAIFACGMEYVARYGHAQLWHSESLWWLHGSHHHVEDIPVGATPKVKEDKYSSQNKLFELNDIFPVVFAVIAVGMILFGVQAPTNCFCKDSCTGLALGVTLFGVSYFIGHDLVAHERAGKGFADMMKALFPYMKECAETHKVYHHKIDQSAKLGQDPYGAPYGFWMGPAEVAALKKDGTKYVPVPNSVALVLNGLTIITMASTAHYIVCGLIGM